MLRSIATVTTLNLLTRGANLYLFGLFAIYMSPQQFGTFALAWTIIAIADSMFDLGITYSFQRTRALEKNSEKTLSAVFIYLGSFWFITLYILSVFAENLDGSEFSNLFIIFGASLFARGTTFSSQVNLIKNQELLPLNLYRFIATLISILAIHIILLYKTNTELFALRFLLLEITLSILLAKLTKFEISLKVDTEQVKKWLKEGSKICISDNVGWILINQIEQWIIAISTSTHILGLFNLAKKPSEVYGQIETSIRKQILFNFFSKKTNNFSTKIFYILLVSSTCATIVLSSLIESFVHNTLNKEWNDSIEILKIIIFTIPFQVAATYLRSYLEGKLQATWVLQSIIFSGLIYIIALILIFHFDLGIKAVAICFVFQSFLLMIILIYKTNSNHENK